MSAAPISDEQLMRAASAFEAIIVKQIEVKEKLGNDLKAAIRVGMVVLGLIAVSLLILLLTLSAQINRISDIVSSMNQNFGSVTQQMQKVSVAVGLMEQRVSLMSEIDAQTAVMHQNMENITGEMHSMRKTMNGINKNVSVVQQNVDHIANAITHMNVEVQFMGRDMNYMSEPARTLQKMLPLP